MTERREETRKQQEQGKEIKKETEGEGGKILWPAHRPFSFFAVKMQLVEVFDATEEELRAELERLKGASDEHGDTERIRQAIHQELLEREASQEVFAALDGNTLSEKPLVSGGVDDKSEEQPSAGAKGEEERGEGRDDDRGEESQRETKDSWNDGEERELQNEAPHASRESMVEFAWQLFEREREAFHKARRHIKVSSTCSMPLLTFQKNRSWTGKDKKERKKKKNSLPPCSFPLYSFFC